eukprot:TRINITY_DN13429_c0_g2_i2.p1 TRINITY_DN13429_c0_g2~~TRINITY_DN13429_c0_g2_i2.p1  ORF type:complete len:461 (-),score=99.40 TRINITY_DN13429_c0_g2_i2:105-1487(-)
MSIDPKEIRNVVNRLFPQIIAALDELLGESNSEVLIGLPQRRSLYTVLLETLQKALFYTRNSESFSALSPLKTLADEKPIHDFVDKLPSLALIPRDVFFQEELVRFVLEMLPVTIPDPLTEVMVRRFILLVDGLVTRTKSSDTFLDRLVPKVFDRLHEYMKLRLNPDYLTVSAAGAKETSVPLWYFASEAFVRISKNVLDQSLAMQQIARAFESQLRFPKNGISKVSKPMMNALLKRSYELDVMFLGAIYGEFSASVAGETNDEIRRLIEILDECSEHSYKFLPNDSTAIEGHATTLVDSVAAVSRASIEHLFAICSCGMDANEDARRVSGIALPILLRRCESVFRSFLIEQNRLGALSVKKRTLDEVIFVLERLRKLELPPDVIVAETSDPSNQNSGRFVIPSAKLAGSPKILQGRKPHLIYLLPVLTACLSIHEEELRSHLQAALSDILLEFGLPAFH